MARTKKSADVSDTNDKDFSPYGYGPYGDLMRLNRDLQSRAARNSADALVSSQNERSSRWIGIVGTIVAVIAVLGSGYRAVEAFLAQNYVGASVFGFAALAFAVLLIVFKVKRVW